MTALKPGEALLKKVEEGELNHIHSLVEQTGNVDIAYEILYRARDINHLMLGLVDNPTYIPDKFGVPIEQILRVAQSLVDSGLIYCYDGRGNLVHFEHKDARLAVSHPMSDVVKNYLFSDIPFGKRVLLDAERGTKEHAMAAMKAVADFVTFYYKLEVQLTPARRAVLSELRARVEPKVREIQEMEEKFIDTMLTDVPPEFRRLGYHFAQTDDWLKDRVGIDVCGRTFDSIDRAFEAGFKTASGYPKTSKPYVYGGGNQPRTDFPEGISISSYSDGTHNIVVNNLKWLLAKQRYGMNVIELRNEAGRMSRLLEDKVRAALSVALKE